MSKEGEGWRRTYVGTDTGQAGRGGGRGREKKKSNLFLPVKEKNDRRTTYPVTEKGGRESKRIIVGPTAVVG